jgi:hypothetical protein
MKTKTIIIILIALTVIGIIIFYIRKKNNKTDAIKNQRNINTSNVTSTSNNIVDERIKNNLGSFPIMKHQNSMLVGYLQRALNVLSNANLSVDGKFGDKTEQALKSAYNVDFVDTQTATKMISDLSRSNSVEAQNIYTQMKSYI